MLRRLALLTIAMLAPVVAVTIPHADAVTTGRGGIVIHTPNSVTAYNKGTVYIKPDIRVKHGVHKVLTGHNITAWSGAKKVRTGGHVRLRAGTYKLQTRVTFRTWNYATKTKTVQVRHDPDYGNDENTTCIVTAVNSEGEVISADCTSDDYPGQTVTVSETHDPHGEFCPQKKADPFTKGEKIDDFCADFKPYYTTKVVKYTVRKWTGHGSVKTPMTPITVKDGGYDKYWSDDDSYTTGYTSVPSGANIYYTYDTSDGYSCYFGLNAETSDGIQSLVDQTRRHGSGSFTTNAAIRVRFDVYSSCDWSVELQWR